MGREWLIDPAQLSAKPRVVAGTAAPGDFERLRGLLANGDGELRYEVSGHLDGKRRKVVSCIIDGFVFLTCQSTLEVFRHPVRVKDRLVLVDHESQLPPIEQETDAEDHVVAGGALDARNLVEDAVILALPMVPRKPGAPAPAPKVGAAEAKPESPFAALGSLKRPRRN